MKNYALKMLFWACVLCVIFPLYAAGQNVENVSGVSLDGPSSVSGLENHYQVSWIKDVPLTVFSAFMSFYGSCLYGKMSVPDSGDVVKTSDLLPWDRPVAGRYSKGADDVGRWSWILGASPLVLGGYSLWVGDAPLHDYGAFSLMLAQALAIQNGINLMVRSSALWPRPYVYATEGDGLEMQRKARGEAYGSFFSGHSSAAFTVAVFTGEWFSEVYPSSPYKGIVWASSLSMASLVGALRVAAGKHYPTDVVVGALVGAGVSLSVIQLHKKAGDRIALWAGLNTCGITASF